MQQSPPGEDTPITFQSERGVRSEGGKRSHGKKRRLPPPLAQPALTQLENVLNKRGGKRVMDQIRASSMN